MSLYGTRIDEQTRKRMHNTIQELKGNIRVFCRIRPVLPSDKGDTTQSYYSCPGKWVTNCGGNGVNKLTLKRKKKKKKKKVWKYLIFYFLFIYFFFYTTW